MIIGTSPIQVARHNDKRRMLSVEFLPASIVAGNTGLVYGKFGSAPVASATSNTWDFLLNPGASNGTNQNEDMPEAPLKQDLWLVSDTAGQVVQVIERNLGEESKSPTP